MKEAGLDGVSISAAAAERPSDVAEELGHFAVHAPMRPELLSQMTVARMGKLVTVTAFRIGDAPQDVFISTVPARYFDDMRITAYADCALDLVTERSEKRLARDAELNRTKAAEAESVNHFALRLQDLREVFYRELRAPGARQSGEVVARYFRNHDDLKKSMQLAQARAAQYRGALLDSYTELSDKDIHDYAAGAYDRPYEDDPYRVSAVTKSSRKRAWLHRLKVGIENYSDIVLGKLDAWWWRAGDLARWLTHAGKA